MRRVVFVAPYALDATARFVGAVTGLAGELAAAVGLLSSDPLERFPDAVRERVVAHYRIDDCLDPVPLAAGVRALAGPLGGVDRLLGILENLQVPLAQARAELGVDGLDATVATNFRDKTQMKAVFEREGVPCARHEQVTDEAGARRFEARVGYPFVVKPPAGAGARGTFRIDSDDQLANWLAADPPTSAAPLLLEEFLTGIEHSFDSVTIDGRRVWHSIGRYDPSPLHVLENPWIQWCVVLPNDIDIPPYQRAAAVAEQAVAALGLHTGFSHLEWFLRPDGSAAISEVGARPPGAQFMSLMSWAHDVDLYGAWAAFAVHDVFEPPPRQHAVGAAYLRAQGSRDRIIAIHGLDDVSPETEALVVESRLPRPGGAVSPTYEGDGYVIVRHPDTLVVERALREIVTAVRVEGGS
jgi:hypothetical protein